MKTKIIYIVSSIIGVAVLCLAFWYLTKGYESKAEGSFTVSLVDLSGEVVLEKEIEFYPEDKLIDLLQENFSNVLVDEFGFLQSIDQFETSYTDRSMIYISIIVDEKYSEVGINLIEFRDGTKIEFKLDEYIYE